jgi:hypothetical protein
MESKETCIEWFYKRILAKDIKSAFEQAKEMEKQEQLEMLHKFGFDYTYNYKGEKTIYEWIPEWFEEYKRLNK